LYGLSAQTQDPNQASRPESANAFLFEGQDWAYLIIIDDHGRSPDSITVFDPLRGVLLLGDLSCGFAGLGATSTSARIIHNLRLYRELAAMGYVRILADSYNQRVFRGRHEILQLLDGLLESHRHCQQAIKQITTDIGARVVVDVRPYL
jgi:hypothetical protein